MNEGKNIYENPIDVLCSLCCESQKHLRIREVDREIVVNCGGGGGGLKCVVYMCG